MASETGQRFLFDILSDVDPDVVGPRLGRLSVKGRDHLETPNFVAVSSRGVVPHITPDVISASSQIGGVHMALEDCEYNGSRARFPFSPREGTIARIDT